MSKNDMVMVPREQLQAWQERFSKAQIFKESSEVQSALAKPAEQDQGKPVALPERHDIPRREEFEIADQYAAALGEAKSWNACLNEIAKLGPLFTHPAPADLSKVGRLRETIRYFEAAHKDSKQHVAKIEAKLAERDALLRDLEGKTILSWPDKHRIYAALSASAEPNAPVEIDERVAFESWGADQGYVNLKREHSGKYKFQTAWAAWEGWRARAALERKP